MSTTTPEPASPIKWPVRKIGDTEVPGKTEALAASGLGLNNFYFYRLALGYGAMSIGGYCYGQADEDQERFKVHAVPSSSYLVCAHPASSIAARPSRRARRNILGHRSYLRTLMPHIYIPLACH